MLEIVLLILKIAGIILAAVLGILIVVVCFALFVPVRYRGDFSVSDREGSEKKAVCAKLRATWFLRLVRVYVSYEESAGVRVKLLFFTLMDTAKGKKAKKQKREKKNGKTAVDTEEAALKEEKIQKEDSGKEAGSAGENAEKKSKKEAKDEKGDPSKNSSEKEKKSIKSRASNILQTIRNFCDKLKNTKEKIENIEELWISDHMAKSRGLLGRQLRYLLKHTKPKSLKGHLRFGFEDPSTTGYAMAFYGILYPIWSPKLSVEPDFENQILDVHILIKGKIRVWHFVRAALRMILSRDVRHVIKDVKREFGNQ